MKFDMLMIWDCALGLIGFVVVSVIILGIILSCSLFIYKVWMLSNNTQAVYILKSDMLMTYPPSIKELTSIGLYDRTVESLKEQFDNYGMRICADAFGIPTGPKSLCFTIPNTQGVHIVGGETELEKYQMALWLCIKKLQQSEIKQ